jgi:phosphoserine aminotransferase
MTPPIQHYFGPGPASLPKVVLEEASRAVLDYEGTGLSILSLPHRSKWFDAILQEANSLVKELCGLGDDYEVLWLQGGGRMQFAMLPMNVLQPGLKAAYADTGHWAHDAMQTAQLYGAVEVVTSSKEDGYRHIPAVPERYSKDTAYLHITSNNTIYGTQYGQLPEVSVPLVADMSSDLLSIKRDYSKLHLFYAVAQKNVGPAGVTVVAIRKDWIDGFRKDLPPALSYRAQVAAGSVVNTPPVFAIYTSLLMLRWTKAVGMDGIEALNDRKAEMLYTELERNALFQPLIDAPYRSKMNVVFRAQDADMEKAFLSFASTRGIDGIAGHRTAGGFRASLYNGVSEDAVKALVAALNEFESQY